MRIRTALIGAVGLALAGIVAGARLQAQAPAQQPQFKSVAVGFVPGEKTIFFDDFTDMGPGDAPPHFKVRGASPDLQASGAARQLLAADKVSLFPNLTALPANFTYESEVKIDVPRGTARQVVVFYSKEREAAAWTIVGRPNGVDLILSRKLPKYEELGRKPVNLDMSQPVKLALWIQDGRLRAFVNGDKHFDVNQVDLPPIDKVELNTSCTGAGVTWAYRSVRFAESAPDFSQLLNASGRYVSHGILFDTNSDRMKVESAPAIQGVARALENNPNLRLLIEGHTDSVGNAATNLDLSKRRAEAVKAVIVSQFSVDASRLTTNGLGATKPIDSNDTPQGRAQNRRVEFVKQ